jgi:uncharacterized membrane protein YkvA (DUF1232 family)
MNQKKSVGFWKGLIQQFRLSWRLLWDPRVPGWTKILPFVALAYIISPIDFIPDAFLGLGQLDDIGILLLGVRLFTELVPEEIMLQHLRKMGVDVGQWRVVDEDSSVIEAEYEIKDE